MKYDEIHDIEFVTCEKIDDNNKHNSKLVDGCCKECIDLYEELKDDVIDDYQFEHKKRVIWDFMEIEHLPDTDRLSFGVWYGKN